MAGNLHNVTEFEPDAIFRALESAAEAMCAAKEKADNLTELRKSVLARLTLTHMKGTKTRKEAEDLALADPEYTEYVRGMNAAEREAQRAKAMYENRRVLANLRQTEEATRRSLTR